MAMLVLPEGRSHLLMVFLLGLYLPQLETIKRKPLRDHPAREIVFLVVG